MKRLLKKMWQRFCQSSFTSFPRLELCQNLKVTFQHIHLSYESEGTHESVKPEYCW